MKPNKFLAFGIIVCMLFGLAVVPAYATTSGICGDNLTWTLDENGTLTISGTGDMDNYDGSNMPWYSSNSSIKNVVISSGVTSIGDCAFFYCSKLMSIIISDTVTSIGYAAFECCTSLASITIPYGVTRIDNSAFMSCSSLVSINVSESNTEYSSKDGVLFNKNQTELIKYPNKKVGPYVIPDSVTSIGYDAIASCTNLTSITIPDSVTRIDGRAFMSCSSLVSINVSESNTEYSSKDGVLFNKNQTELIKCPCGKAGEYIIPDGVTSVWECAFSSCRDLTSVTIGNDVKIIRGGAFSQCCSLTSVNIPNSVKTIGGGAFFKCTSLESVTIGNGVISIEGNAFGYCENLVAITIGNHVNSIGGHVFDGCNSLTSIMIPDSVKSIGEDAFGGNSLISINVSESNVEYSSRDGVLFDKNQTELIKCPNGRVGLYVIPDGVTKIGNRAFSDCESINSIIISDSVISIGKKTFAACNSLTSIDIPDSVKSIGYSAFYECDFLTDVYYSGTEEDWNKISIDSGNYDLTNATRHHIPALSVARDENTFTVMPKNVEAGSIILTTYKNGAVTELKTAEYDGEPAEFTVTSDYDSIKIMLWNSFNDMQPLVSAKKQ